MTIDDNKRALFIHMPKNAGSSIYKAMVEEGARHICMHIRAERAKDRLESLGYEWDRLYKFSFVRNPFARVASWYLWLKHEVKNGRNSEKIIDPGTFDNFVKNYRQVYHDVPFESMSYDIHECQADILSIDGRIAMDYIGRVESIDRDWTYIKSRLGYISNVEHHKKDDGHKYDSLFTPYLKKIIRERYAKDFEEFNYT